MTLAKSHTKKLLCADGASHNRTGGMKASQYSECWFFWGFFYYLKKIIIIMSFIDQGSYKLCIVD